MQTPAPTEYERATSVDGAIESLAKLGPTARLVAGGHSLIPMMKLRLAQPESSDRHQRSGRARYIETRGGDEVRIGALTRHVTLLKSDLLAELFPIFREAEQVIADPVVRNRGTIGGSLCQADPAEDLSAVCEALKGRRRDPQRRRRARGHDGRVPRRPVHDGRRSAEMLTELRFTIRPGAGSAHEKLERRAGDFAIAAASAAVWVDGGQIIDAGIALAAVGPFTIDAKKAEEHLIGKAPSEQLFTRGRRRSPPRRRCPAPTDADRSTTSAT